MPDASLRVDTRAQGADLRAIARELRAMDDRKVKDLFKRKLEPAAARFVPRVRASVMAIPVKADGKQTGLRARIADCVQVASWEPGTRQVSVAVEIDPKRMPAREMSLPLMMEGAKRWRHPVYGNRDNWAQQPPHPYFYQAASGFGRAGGDAIRAALEDITRQING
jgi:hypothetical protein